MPEEVLHHLLLYTYVENMLERRTPYRPEHIERIVEAKESGQIVMAGALGNPPTGGALVWRGATVEQIEAFVAADPYQQAGLLTDYRIEPWALV